MWCASKVNYWLLTFFDFDSDMKQAVSPDILLYPDVSCLVFQHKHVTEITEM